MGIDTSHTETALLLRVAAGEETAFRQLVDEYGGLLHTFILRHTASAPLAEELVQDIFLQIWLTRETMTSVRNFRTYLYVVARNYAINMVKKLIREEQRLREYQQQADGTEEKDHAELELHLSVIEEAIEQLPARKKRAWILSRREGKTYKEVAEEMNISRETVKTHLQIAQTLIFKYVAQKMDILVLLGILKKISD